MNIFLILVAFNESFDSPGFCRQSGTLIFEQCTPNEFGSDSITVWKLDQTFPVFVHMSNDSTPYDSSIFKLETPPLVRKHRNNPIRRQSDFAGAKLRCAWQKLEQKKT
jgi:hypothetical protein